MDNFSNKGSVFDGAIGGGIPKAKIKIKRNVMSPSPAPILSQRPSNLSMNYAGQNNGQRNQ